MVDILIARPLRTTNYVKNKILKNRLLDYSCSGCGNTGTWLGDTLSLQLHHKDGDKHNHALENLEFLCPNCHSQTDTYSHKNIKRPPKPIKVCRICYREIKYSGTGLCRSCSAKNRSLGSKFKS